MSPRACLGSCALALLLAGCGAYPTATVSGRVTLDGKALPDATVMFVPAPPAASKDKDPLPSSVGVTDADGRYTLMLNSGPKTKGAVVGKHKVIIVLGARGPSSDEEPTFHKQLPEEYNRRTRLECDVPARGRDDANFDLTSQ
jgi:hypothetical protein